MWSVVEGKEVLLAEAEDVGAIDGEEAEAAVEVGQLVEVQREHKEAVNKAMRPRPETGVHNKAFVDAGLHTRAEARGRRDGPSRTSAGWAECTQNPKAYQNNYGRDLH